MIHDWEVQEAHRQYKRRYGEAALEHLKRMYGETIPADNLHFIMGTMAAHPRTFGLDLPPMEQSWGVDLGHAMARSDHFRVRVSTLPALRPPDRRVQTRWVAGPPGRAG